MMLIFRWFILSISIMAAAYLIDGIHVSGFWGAFLTAAILGLLNTFLRPILLLLTLPINILSLGLFTFVINAILLMMASGVIAGFEVRSFGSALLGSLVISGVNWILNILVRETGYPSQGRPSGKGPFYKKSDGSKDYIDLEKKDDDRWE